MLLKVLRSEQLVMGDYNSDEWYRGAYYGDHPPACTCVKCTEERLAGQNYESPATAARHALERKWEAEHNTRQETTRPKQGRGLRDFVGPAVLTAILVLFVLSVLGIVWVFDQL